MTNFYKNCILEEEKNVNKVKRLFEKINEVGLRNTIIGLGRRKKLQRICRKYGLDTWHQSPYELRRYAQIVAHSVNELGGGKINSVVEVGCGLGEILRHIRAEKRYGYDICSNVIEVAQSFTRPKKHIKYCVGGLENVDVLNADCLITIGWMHGATDDYLKSAYQIALEKNRIKYVVVDVRDVEDLKKDFSQILPSGYRRVLRRKCTGKEIWIEVYRYGGIKKYLIRESGDENIILYK